MKNTTPQVLLYGTFYPEYDIIVIIVWILIIVFGMGNWLLFWLFIRTKALRTPFNVLVLALSFSNGLSTTVVGPMELFRIVTLFEPVSLQWCQAKIVVKTFCFSVSLLVIFTLSVLRLHAGIQVQRLEPTVRGILLLISLLYLLAALSSILLLDPSSSTTRLCLGQVDIEMVAKRLAGGGEGGNSGVEVMSKQVIDTVTEIPDLVSTPHPEMVSDSWMTSEVTFNWTLDTNNSQYEKGTGTPDDTLGASKRLWVYFFYMTFLLFVGTLICYLTLVIVLKKKKTKIGHVIIGNKRDILTLKVAAIVTLSFFICYLVPFMPALYFIPVQASAANLHYTALYACLSSIEGALEPVIFITSNKINRKAFLKLFQRSANAIVPASSLKVSHTSGSSSKQPSGLPHQQEIPTENIDKTSSSGLRKQYQSNLHVPQANTSI